MSSRPSSLDLEYTLQKGLDEVYGSGVLVFCPEHRTVLTTTSFNRRHGSCRSIGTGSLVYSEIEIQARLRRIVSELYQGSRKIHEPCGQILHITSWDRHATSCKVENSESESEGTKKPSKKKRKRGDSSASGISKKPKRETSSLVIDRDLTVFISELHKQLNLWKDVIRIIQGILASYGLNFKSDDESFLRDIALLAMYFCKGVRYSEEDLGEYSPSFPKLLKCLLKQGHIELLKLQSFGGSATDFLHHASVLFLLDVPKNSIVLPEPDEPFSEAETAIWIGILDDLFMRLAEPLSRYIEATLAEFGISLEEAAKRSLGTVSGSIVLKSFLEKGAKREEMDAYLCLSILIHEFRRICVRFRNSLLYVGKKRGECITYVENLKYIRNKIAHANNPSLNVFENPRNLGNESILLSALIIHELAEEIQDSSFLAFIKLQLPKFYPHDLTTIKIMKSVVDMSDEEKQSLLACIEHSQKLGNKLVAIRNSSLKLVFFVPK